MEINKRKIINDPVHGFINVPTELIFDLIDHNYFQRLRRIKQLGLTNFVYPGANHTRFQHALGAMHLMNLAINVIRSKGCEITDEEAEAVTIAILLHDIGHGPYSHSLESSLIEGVSHEDLSMYIMDKLNKEFHGKLDLALDIFHDQYKKKFLHQLVSSQLDMDRLDYLKRDSFFTGVTEGVIGSDRIIKMLNVKDDQLVIDYKGIYSIEKFLIARRLMYWQVYLHKTVLSAENLLLNTLRRAKELARKGTKLFAVPSLEYFLYNNIGKENFLESDSRSGQAPLDVFTSLDDNDVLSSIKEWGSHEDVILGFLSRSFINRRLYKVEIQNEPIDQKEFEKRKNSVANQLGISDPDINHLVFTGIIENNAYNIQDENIKILQKSGELIDISEVSEIINTSVLSKTMKKYYMCYPKIIN